VRHYQFYPAVIHSNARLTYTRVAAVLEGKAADPPVDKALFPSLQNLYAIFKALLGARAPSREGTVAEAIRVTGAAKRSFTRQDIADRARRVLDMAVRQGTTAMRSHVEVDPIVGLMGFEAILPLRREYAPAIDLQLCAFAQEGILQMPGTEALLREALHMGADLVGGVPYNDTDAHRHIAIVFDLAAEFVDDLKHLLRVREIQPLVLCDVLGRYLEFARHDAGGRQCTDGRAGENQVGLELARAQASRHLRSVLLTTPVEYPVPVLLAGQRPVRLRVADEGQAA